MPLIVAEKHHSQPISLLLVHFFTLQILQIFPKYKSENSHFSLFCNWMHTHDLHLTIRRTHGDVDFQVNNTRKVPHKPHRLHLPQRQCPIWSVLHCRYIAAVAADFCLMNPPTSTCLTSPTPFPSVVWHKPWKSNFQAWLQSSRKFLPDDLMLSHVSHVQLFATPWTVAHQSPLSMGFCRKEYWSGLVFPPWRDLLGPGIEPVSPESPALAGGFFTTEPLGKTSGSFTP